MLKLYNTLTRKVEDFHPLHPPEVTLYACGPTVYDYVHIGNLRTFVFVDSIVRTLKYMGYRVKYVSNITDVGHLVSDADTGEDKMEKGAKREGKTAWDIAKFYTDAFLADSKKMNLTEPDVRPRPTEHIKEQIAAVEALLAKDFAYRIDDGIYFDTSKFSDYGALTGQNRDELKEGARVEPNPQKKNITDFALWKFTPKGVKRQMEWESPWGMGFPGWHIECSCMSMKYLGNTIDIHAGGVDLIPIHHTNEIAQSEAASGISPFVRYWVHGQFILVDGEKMAKAKGNFYTLSDIENKVYDPLALRYFFLTAHYRAYLNFTWDALTGSKKSLDLLREHVASLKDSSSVRTALSEEKLNKIDRYNAAFKKAIENDLNIPQALAVVWEVVKTNIASRDKLDLLFEFDEVLGLNLRNWQTPPSDVSAEITELAVEREKLRRVGKFDEADDIRKKIESTGFEIEDTSQGPRIRKKS
jgi:cysteinyl-tRNA synthetase